MSKVRSIGREIAKRQAKDAKIVVTLGCLLDSQEALRSLAGQPLPATRAFMLAKIIRAVTEELRVCEETKLKLFEQYGERVDEVTFSFPDEAKLAELNREWATLRETEIAINGERLDLEALPSITISAADLILLEWLIG